MGLKEEPKGSVKNSLRQTNGEPSKSLGDAADTALRKLPAVSVYGSMQEDTQSNTAPQGVWKKRLSPKVEGGRKYQSLRGTETSEKEKISTKLRVIF